MHPWFFVVLMLVGSVSTAGAQTDPQPQTCYNVAGEVTGLETVDGGGNLIQGDLIFTQEGTQISYIIPVFIAGRVKVVVNGRYDLMDKDETGVASFWGIFRGIEESPCGEDAKKKILSTEIRLRAGEGKARFIGIAGEVLVDLSVNYCSPDGLARENGIIRQGRLCFDKPL